MGQLFNSGMHNHLKIQHRALLIANEMGSVEVSGFLTGKDESSEGRGRNITLEIREVGGQIAKHNRKHLNNKFLHILEEVAGVQEKTSKDKNARITCCQGAMIVLEDKPFSLGENSGFHRFVAELAPKGIFTTVSGPVSC